MSKHPRATSTPLERFENHDDPVHRTTTSTSNPVMMTSELFERLYLQPMTKVEGNLRTTFGNPTPLGLVGLVIGLTPLACSYMGWRGAGNGGAADIAVYIFVSGPCLFVAGLLEFFLGNTFSFVVFFAYGAIFLAEAGTILPSLNAAAAYDPKGNAAAGALTQGYNASLAFFPLMVGVLNFIWFICALKINVVFVLIFVTAGTGYFCEACAYFALAQGATMTNSTLIQATGVFWFLTALLLWYLLLIQLMTLMGYTIHFPVGDLTHFSEKKVERKEKV